MTAAPVERHGPWAAADDLTTTGFADLVDRALGVACLLVLLPTILSAAEQLGNVHRWWLAIFGGAIVATSVLMPLYAWSRRGVRPLAGLYALASLAALATWPFAWSGSGPGGPPLVWATLGLALVCAALAAGPRTAVVTGVLTAMLYFAVRLHPSGGEVGPFFALRDALLVVLQPGAFLLILHHLRQGLAHVDGELARHQTEIAEAAVNQALVDERRRFDAIVHDEIMTTLVAGAHAGPGDEAVVAGQARDALARLHSEPDADEQAPPASADQLVRLIKDVTSAVCPRITVTGEIPAAAVVIPQPVVRALMQAAREAALNAERHADAGQVHADVAIVATQRRVQVRVTIVDDGRGFVAAEIPPERLGIKVALGERMSSVGGAAHVTSAVGRGTTVRLSWSGERSRRVEPHPRTLANLAEHPLFSDLDARPYVVVSVALTVIYAAEALFAWASARHPAWAALAAGLLVAALALVVPALLHPPMRHGVALLATTAAVGVSGASLAALDGGPWSHAATWFATPVMLVLLLVYAGSRAVTAWLGAGAHALGVLGVGFAQRQAPSQAILAALLPVGWLTLAAAAFYWFDEMWAQLDDAERAADESAQLNAASFSKLVVGEVWLAELRSQVGPLLERLASSQPLSDADRAALLLTESSLRDGIKASNFSAPGLSAAIMAARRRGVAVTLVDNRGSRLPEAARRAAIRELTRTVSQATTGRIVARTAPEGYGEAVTILQVGASGETNLTRIDADGALTTGAAAAPTE